MVDGSAFMLNMLMLKKNQVTHSGTTPDNDVWIARKRNSVIRFGCSTWQLHNKFNGGDEDLFKRKNGLGERAGEVCLILYFWVCCSAEIGVGREWWTWGCNWNWNWD